MATLSNTYGLTLNFNYWLPQGVEYQGAANNQYFGGSSDRVAMLRYTAPSALNAGELLILANFIASFKADTAADSDTITIGLINGAWTTTTTNEDVLASYLADMPTMTYAINTSTTATEKTINITSLLQIWAANPSAYSGIYFRCPTLSLCRIGYSGQKIDTTIGYTTACGAPTSANVAPSLCESDPTLNASGAVGGAYNAISGYEIQYAESADGTTYGAWTALKTVSTTGSSLSTTVTLPSVRGCSRKYRLRTRGAAGSSYYSDWKETNAIKRNSLPTAPTAFTASPEIYLSGEIVLTYSGAADPDGNLSTHNIQFATKSGVEAWSGWSGLANGLTSHTPTLTPGQSIKYRVRAVDALGAVSDWLESNACVKNTAPAAPTVNYPQAGKTIHNNRPRILITLGADPEGHLQKLLTGDFTASRTDTLTAGEKIVLRRTSSASSGAVGYSIKSADQYNEESTAKTGSLTYAAPSFTDPVLSVGNTRIKAAHINEIRVMVNTIRQYYGLEAIVWNETITAGITKTRNWRDHVTEIRSAINDVISLINSWDSMSSVNRVQVPSWIVLRDRPSASVLNQLRSVTASL